MKIATIVGARPQFIKSAPLSGKLRKHFTEVLVHTGQHYDQNMSNVFFSDLDIPIPDYNLDIGQGSSGYHMSKIFKKIEQVFQKEKPDLIIVFGDTNSTMAGAISAVQHHIPVAHVEAGPRNTKLDVPEMLNRLVTDRISSLLFCATKRNYENLKTENIHHNAHYVGDIMYELYLRQLHKIRKNKKILNKLGLKPNEYHIASFHRAENVDSMKRSEEILKGFIISDQKIVFSLHPRTKKNLISSGLLNMLENSSNVLQIEPVGYNDFLSLAYFSNKIITDSGGLQREAYFMEKPCINIYDHTYWPEIEEDGWQVVTGMDAKKISDAIKGFRPKKKQSGIFGDGKTSEKIVEIIIKFNREKAFDFNP
tara:strand:- start:82 stop:1179 length:1098 start_codon:yes stop_codon:yes gene_type:complete